MQSDMAGRIRKEPIPTGNVILGTVIAVILILLVTTPARALEISRPDDFHGKHFAGGRVGIYSNTSGEIPGEDPSFFLDFSSNSIYAEFFYAYRLARPLAAEFSIGIFSRGEAQYIRLIDTVNNIGTDAVNNPVLLYPIWLSLKIYPLYKFDLPVHLFLQPGAGLIFGRHDIVDYYSYTAYAIDTESRAKITYLLAAGFDIQVTRQIGLTAGFKYLPADFGKPLARVEDYTGWTLAFGIGYLFGK
jgi:opacity protein-like surface antigen